MRIRSAFLALTVLPAALAFAPTTADADCALLDDAGTAEDAADDVLACEAAVYFQCDTAHGGKLHVPSSLGTGVELAAAAPTQSVTEGAGCGQYETSQASGTATTSIYDLNATGFIEGNVDSVTVELHQIYAAPQRTGGDVTLNVRLVVSGKSPTGFTESEAAGTGGVIGSPESFDLEVPLVQSETGASDSMTFTITDLYDVFPELSKAGDGTNNFQTLDVTVSVQETAWVGAFVWGTTEVPASVRINAGELGTVVSAATL